jgi:hypothetical protein
LAPPPRPKNTQKAKDKTDNISSKININLDKYQLDVPIDTSSINKKFRCQDLPLTAKNEE